MTSEQSVKLRAALDRNRRPAGPVDVVALRALMEATAFPLPEEIGVEDVNASGVPARWLTPPRAEPRDGALLYLHGGGYVMGSPRTHGRLCADIARAAGVVALAPDYRLAPEHPFPAALDDAVASFHWLLDRVGDARKIVIAGDSAGGGLTIAMLRALRDRDVPMPAAALCISPWIDLTLTTSNDPALDETDPIASLDDMAQFSAWFLDGDAHAAAAMDSLRTDLSGLPPVLLQVSEHELLVHDARAFAANATAAGVDVTLDVWPEMVHVWHLFAGRLPEGVDAIDVAGRFLRAHLATTAN